MEELSEKRKELLDTNLQLNKDEQQTTYDSFLLFTTNKEVEQIKDDLLFLIQLNEQLADHHNSMKIVFQDLLELLDDTTIEKTSNEEFSSINSFIRNEESQSE